MTLTLYETLLYVRMIMYVCYIKLTRCFSKGFSQTYFVWKVVQNISRFLYKLNMTCNETNH
jgi:hypothetical protein